jgi:flagellar biosynthetic protein FliR
MTWLYELGLQQFLVFTLVLTRVSGLVATAPIYGSGEVPPQIRVLLAFALSLVVAPSQIGAAVPFPETLLNWLVLAGGELLVGAALGLGVQILFQAGQVAGQLISQVSGMSLADVFNPSLDSTVPLFSQLLYLFTLAIFLLIGGHRLVMAGLLGTFDSIPLASGAIPLSLAETFTGLVASSMELGLRAAAPATTALLLATVILGLISRTLPQLNIMVVGFGINALVTLGTLSISLGAIAWIFQVQVEPFIAELIEALGAGAGD